MIIEQLESKIKALPYDKVIPFSYIDIEIKPLSCNLY